jgi:hypothetical protein
MTTVDPREELAGVRAAINAVRAGQGTSEEVLQALTALRLLRDELATWEPELITAARESGTSWAALAPAIGVASRQAAERRYLRLRPSDTGETTGEARVDAQRDRRAGDRAVATWARQNSAALRTLAGLVGALEAVTPEKAGRLTDALGDDDAAALLPALAATHPDLATHHTALADQVTAIREHTDRLRRDATSTRREGLR